MAKDRIAYEFFGPATVLDTEVKPKPVAPTAGASPVPAVGAITVDWVVLSAAIIGLGMVVLIPIAYSTESSTQQIADGIENQPVGYGNN